MSAATMPRSAIRCSSRFLTSSDGSVTDGDCRPSRSVSSLRSTRARVQSKAPSGPPALTSDQYTADYNEVKAFGGATGSARTAEQTKLLQDYPSLPVM